MLNTVEWNTKLGITTEEAPMKLDHPVLKGNNQKAHSLLDRRYADRVPIRYRISYSGEEGARIIKGEGTLKDLSKTGCKIAGAITSSLGTTLTLLLHLEDGQAPMRLANVVVSWMAEDSFAVRFPRLSAEERKRVQEVIWKNASLSTLEDRRTAFRIV
jgi:hypothetical protein